MTNIANHSCPRCGAAIAHGSLQGLCPSCLALIAFSGAPESKPTVVVSFDVDDTAPAARVAAKPLLSSAISYFGDYELLEEIARGGMGVVYRARQSSLNRIVAVKMILTNRLASEMEIRRFYSEAEAAANLQHPNIVAIHEIGEHEGQHYFSMDFVGGENLAAMTRRGPLPAIRAAELARTIAEAIQFAHQRGILHRDLKPQNVLIDSQGVPRITDFGIAKRVDQDSTLTSEGAVMGTPSYMSPEQAAGRRDLQGPASDVYSLGAILYELLTGQPPFRGKTPIETIQHVIENAPPAPSKLNPKVPVDLETICLKCLEKKTDRRYSSAGILADELGRFLNHEPILARPVSAFRKAGAWFQRHPWVISAALSLLVLSLAGLSFGLWDKSRYLIWLQTHTPPKKSAEGQWFIISAMALLPICLFMAPFVFLDFVDRKRRGFPLQLFHLRLYSLLALPGLAASLNFTLSLAHELVWQRRATLWLIFFAFPGAWFGALILWNAVKEYQSLQFGFERPEAAVLFPPKPKTAWKLPPETIGDRAAFNFVALAVILAGSLISAIGGWISTHADAGRLFTMIAAGTAGSWLILYWWRNTKSAAKHVILLFGLLQLMVPLTFGALISIDERFRELFLIPGAQWIALGIGLGLGWFLQRVIQHSKRIKAGQTTVQTGEYGWVQANRGLFLLLFGFGNILLLGTSSFWLPASMTSPPLLASVCFGLCLELVFFLRSARSERKTRTESLIVWLLAGLATSPGLSFVEIGRQALAGVILGALLLTFVVWKSKEKNLVISK